MAYLHENWKYLLALGATACAWVFFGLLGSSRFRNWLFAPVQCVFGHNWRTAAVWYRHDRPYGEMFICTRCPRTKMDARFQQLSSARQEEARAAIRPGQIVRVDYTPGGHRNRQPAQAPVQEPEAVSVPNPEPPRARPKRAKPKPKKPSARTIYDRLLENEDVTCPPRSKPKSAKSKQKAKKG